MHSVILEGEAHKKSLGTPNFRPFLKKLFVCIENNYWFLVAGFSIHAVQSLQLEHDGQSKFYVELIVFPLWQ